MKQEIRFKKTEFNIYWVSNAVQYISKNIDEYLNYRDAYLFFSEKDIKSTLKAFELFEMDPEFKSLTELEFSDMFQSVNNLARSKHNHIGCF